MHRSSARNVLGLGIVACALIYLLALATFDIADIPERAWPVNAETRNVLGPEGARLAFAAFEWFGILPAFALGLGAFAIGVACLWTRAEDIRTPRAPNASLPEPAWFAIFRPLGAFSFLVALATIEALLGHDGVLGFLHRPGLNPGGYWGAYCAAKLEPAPSPLLAYGLVVFGATAGALLALDPKPRRGSSDGKAPMRRSKQGCERDPEPPPSSPATTTGTAQKEPPCAPASPLVRIELAPKATERGSESRNQNTALGEQSENADEPHSAPSSERPCETEVRSAPAPVPDSGTSDAGVAGSGPSGGANSPKHARNKTRKAGRRRALPPATLLEAKDAPQPERYEEELREQAETLSRTLADFRVDARVVSAERGPNITTFELELAAGVKINRIAGLAQDLALALGVPSVRLVGPSAGRSTLGIEAPNRHQETVRLAELIESESARGKQRMIPLFLGKDARGAPLVADLARMPHLLIAGATGSGKSVCTNSIILSVLLTRTPDEVRMILIDPKMVELALYEKVPHLLAPVVTDMRQAPAILEWAVEKMEARYRLLSRAQVRQLKSYNALGKRRLAERLGIPVEELEERSIPWRMPSIVIVIDEFADLMCVAKKEVETSVVRLAQKSRAVGIHLILATQRPTADVITGLIKSNMPSRIAFKVASKLDSRTIIDRNGAETLVGQGDMLYLPPGTSRLVRAQGTFVSDDEVKRVVEHVKAAGEPQFDPELLNAGKSAGGDDMPKDPLFDKAVRIVLETGRGSASLLQRQLEIGYSRASRLIDQMTDLGILGPFKGSKAREILMTLEQWEARRREHGGVEG